MVSEKRLIDACDLIEWLDDFDRENTLRVLMGKKAKLLNSHAIKNMIVTVPTVDAVEVVHGRWELMGEADYKCSVCGFRFTSGDPISMFPYCRCGTKMDGAENG
jgi:hypothetical protein